MTKPGKNKRQIQPQIVPVVRAAKAFVGDEEGQPQISTHAAAGLKRPTRKQIKRIASELVDWETSKSEKG